MDIASFVHQESDWPANRFNNRQGFLLHSTYDDEGAVEIFFNKTWKEINGIELLKNPTSSWFLSDLVFCSMLPALVGVSFWAADSGLNDNSELLADHTIANLMQRWDRISNGLSSEQRKELKRFVRRFGQPDDDALFNGSSA